MNQLLATHPHLAVASPVGVGMQLPNTNQGIGIAIVLAAIGGGVGWWLGGKRHPIVGATVGAVAGAAVVPFVGSTLIGFSK